VPLQVVDEVGPATCLQFGQAWLLIGLILFNLREEICRVNEKEALLLLQQNEKNQFFVDDPPFIRRHRWRFNLGGQEGFGGK
jgi:hypothetical protein